MATHHLQSLERAAQGDWDGAHRLIQSHGDTLACLVHGYLHRVEGDNGNAAYWYNRAGHSLPANSLAEEFERLYELAKNI
jgi:hypothetical protein